MDFKIVFSSENSLQVQFEQKISREVNEQVSTFVKCFCALTSDVPEIHEIVPTYCAATIYFDDKNLNPKIVRSLAEAALGESILELKTKEEDKYGPVTETGKIITIPVCYQGEDFAPDLEAVAQHAGISVQEVIKLHSSPDYLIYMLGFLPGFPYLGGLDEKLATPRLDTPRTKIPAGSVAIGGNQTGLYPENSPGGWRIIGRTPLKLFDKNRNPVCYYNAGDIIRFKSISNEEFENFDEGKWKIENGLNLICESVSAAERHVAGGGIKILEGGISSTIQDYGRKGFERFGIGQGGAMDIPSFDLANQLCRNPAGTPCIEAVLAGPVLEFVTACDFAITGARITPRLNGTEVKMNELIHADAGDVLECGYASEGLRIYISFRGGILHPKNFNSCCDNTKLKKGDQLAIGVVEKQKFDNIELLPVTFEKELELNCIAGPQSDFFNEADVKKFTENTYIVSAESNRMGIRFEGESLDCGKTDIISDAIPFGAVQITSKGLPVVMAADRQTTGGYAKIATVTKESMYRLAQAVPGTKVKFNFK